MVIGIPQADLTSDLQESLWLGIAVAGTLVLFGLLWARTIGGQIGRSIEALKAPALALASSRRPTMPSSGMTEVAEVGAALARTWDLLEQRSLDRARAEAEEKAAIHRLTERSTELERSNAELEQFAYAAAHDLRSPLGAIAHLVDWIEQDIVAGSDQEVTANLALLRGRVDRMQALLDGLLAYAQIGRRQDHAERVDTAALVQGIAAELARPGFRIACTAPMPVLHTNSTALERVLSILVANGLQHHDRTEGHIEVSACLRDGIAEFRVRDDGPGIAERFQKRIFDIFQTLQSRDDMESSGVGLAIAMKKVTARGGRIWVESTPPARGACFAFTWPCG
jgi:signal transduction histidine kinase